MKLKNMNISLTGVIRVNRHNSYGYFEMNTEDVFFVLKYTFVSDHKIHTMPRSNKKKKLLFQPSVPTDDEAVTQLLRKETTTMISRAIVNI